MSASSLRLAFYADDFTGATDALEVLADAGLACVLFLEVPDAATLARHRKLDAIGIAGSSRTMSGDEMDAELPTVFESLARTGASIVHYKVCSTFDSSPTSGSIGRVVQIARGHFGNACVPIVAATPHLGRTCLYGHLFARSGTDGLMYRLDRHPIMSAHPVTPMDESDLAIHLARQAELRIVKLTLDDVRRGAQHLRTRITGLHDADAALIDGFDAADLRVAGVALVALATARPVFVVGGSGVEQALTSAWAGGQVPARAPPARAADGPVLALSGSASALSAAQIDAAVRAGFADVPLDTARLIDERAWRDYAGSVCAEAAAALRGGRSVILHTARGPNDPRVAAAAAAAAAPAAAREAASAATRPGGRLLGERLGEIAKHLAREIAPRRIVISGGDTASAIARALDIRAVEFAACLAPGAPLCRVLESSLVAGAEIAFKGGQMGSRDFFEEARRGLAA